MEGRERRHDLPLGSKTPALRARLFTDLVQSAGVSPFLFAVDSNVVLIGVIGPRPVSPASLSQVRLSNVLERHSSGVNLFRGSTWSLRTPVAHRFDKIATMNRGGLNLKK